MNNWQGALWKIAEEVAKQDGRADDLEMGDTCLYCRWKGPSGDEIVHDKACIVMLARELLEWRKQVTFQEPLK